MTTTQTALVTGATEGIGRAIAFALGKAGWQVGICARSATHVDATIADLEHAGIAAAGLPADVNNPDEVDALVRHVESALGPIDTLVNNAGTARIKPFAELTVEDFDVTMNTNVRGLFLVTRAVLPGLRARGTGDIVNIASLAGRNGFVGGSAYTASKHAVLGFSKSLMLEVRKEGVRVIAICPGSVDTQFIHAEPRDPERILAPDDVADLVLAAVRLPRRALLSELDLRPTTP